MRNLLLIAVLCVLSAAGGFLLYTRMAGPDAAGRDGAMVGQPAPDVTMQDLDGTRRSLAEWRGKLVLVNFWATWCTPCLHEIPLLVDAQDRFGPRGLQIVGPAMDDPAAVRSYMDRLAIDYPVLVGSEDVSAAMDALGDTLGALPYSVLIDPDGRIVMTQHGEFTRESLDALIRAHLP